MIGGIGLADKRLLWDDSGKYTEASEHLPSCVPESFPFSFLNDKNNIARAILFKNYHIFMHCHDYYELNFITEGRGVHFFGDNKFNVEKGCFFIVPPNVRHGYVYDEGITVFHIVIDRAFLKQLGIQFANIKEYAFIFNYDVKLKKDYNFQYMLKFEGEGYNKLLDLFNTVYSIAPIDAKNSPCDGIDTQLIRGCIVQIVALTCRHYINQINAISDKSQNNIVIGAIDYITNHLSESILTEHVAKKVGCSIASLNRYFRSTLDTTPQKFIVMQKIDKAKELLLDTDLSVTEISIETGFFDCSHFIKHFKNLVGTTPLNYRAMARSGEDYHGTTSKNE